MKSKPNDPHNKTLAEYLRHSQAGLQFFLTVGIFTAGGIWLDSKLRSGVLWTLLGLALGFGGGLRALYLDIYGREDKRTASRDRRSDPENSDEKR